MTHSPEQVSDDDDWLPADWLDWLDDDTLDCELLDGLLWLDELGLLDEPLDWLLADEDELRWQVPNRTSNGNSPGELSYPPQMQGDVQSPSSIHAVPFQTIMHSPPQVRLVDEELPDEATEDDPAELTDELERLLLDWLDCELLDWLDDDPAQEPNRASPSNRPGDVSNPVQTQGDVQSSLVHCPFSQYAMHSPPQVKLLLDDEPLLTDDRLDDADELDWLDDDRLE